MSRTRRWLFLGVVLAGSAGLAAWGWRAWTTPPPLPEVDLREADPAVAAAVTAARQAVELAPGSAEAWGRLGMVLGAHGFAPEAAACLDRAARLAPSEPVWPYLAGVVLSATDPEGGVARIRAALARAPGRAAAARLRLAELLLVLGEWEEAKSIADQLRGSPEHAAEASLGLARVAVARGELTTARTQLESVVASPRTAKAARLLLAEVCRRLGEREQAARLAQEAEHLPDDPPRPDPWLERMERLQVGEQAQVRRADRLLQQGDSTAALALLERTARDYPHSPAVWQTLGRTLVRLGRYPQAAAAFRRVIVLAPGRAEAVFYLGVTAYEQGDKRDAAGHFERATQLRPEHALAWHNLGQCRRELGDPTGALAAFRQALQYKPHNPATHVALAGVLAQSGRPEEARQHLRTALRLAPGDREAAQLLERLVGKQ